MGMFLVGDRVFHVMHGVGTIVAFVRGAGNTAWVRFDRFNQTFVVDGGTYDHAV